MIFCCREATQLEALGNSPGSGPGAFYKKPGKLWTKSWGPHPRSAPLQRLERFEWLVTLFTCRQLSYDSDALNAFAGTLHALSQEKDPVYNLAGLPYYRGPHEAGSLISIERAIGYAVSWYSTRKPPRVRAMFPSWTWASRTGMASWAWLDWDSHRTLLRDVKLEDKSGNIVVLPEQSDSVSGSDLQNDLNRVATIEITAPTIPGKYIEEYRDSTTYRGIDARMFGTCQDLSVYTSLAIRKAFASNVQKGLWTCFVIAEDDWNAYQILLCKWINESTAERIGCFIIRMESKRWSEYAKARFEKPRRVKLV